MTINRIYLRDFKLEGYDPFYTRSVFFYIRQVGVNSVSSFEEIESLKTQVKEAMLSDSLISNKIDKHKIITRYFSELNIAFRSLKHGGNNGKSDT